MPMQPKSWLFVPANQPHRITKALQTSADAFILDLEDSVAESEKRAAREEIARAAKSLHGRNVWVRVNSSGSAWYAEDMAAARAVKEIVGVFLPKSENAADLPAQGELAREEGPLLKTALLIESARGVLNLHSMLSSRPDISAVMFGGAQGGDLMSDLGCEWSIDGPEMLHARQHTLLAIRAAENVQAIDGVFSALDDVVSLDRDTRLSRRLGYRARAVVHPSQIGCVNEIYAPHPAELSWAQRVDAAFKEALEKGSASIRVDGRLVDYAMYKTARRVLECAP